jgi:hypothetical protein
MAMCKVTAFALLSAIVQGLPPCTNGKPLHRRNDAGLYRPCALRTPGCSGVLSKHPLSNAVEIISAIPGARKTRSISTACSRGTIYQDSETGINYVRVSYVSGREVSRQFLTRTDGKRRRVDQRALTRIIHKYFCCGAGLPVISGRPHLHPRNTTSIPVVLLVAGGPI